MTGPASVTGSAAVTGAVAGVDATWTEVCSVADIPAEGGVAALVAGEPVAVFRTHDDEVHAISNVDPFSGASVLSRGIVGSRGDVPVVSSPMYKQAFDLRTGRCLDDDAAVVAAYVAAVVSGRVLVGPVKESP